MTKVISIANFSFLFVSFMQLALMLGLFMGRYWLLAGFHACILAIIGPN